MNLQSKKARIPIAALGVAALACGAGALFNPAQAVGADLGYGPTPTSATIVDVNPNSSEMNATLTYGFKVTGSSDTTSPTILAAASTNPGSLYTMRGAGNIAPIAPTYSSTLSAGTSAGATTFTVGSTTGLAVGNLVTVGVGTSAETLAVVTVPNGTTFTTAAAANAHGAGDPVNLVSNTTLTANSAVNATSFTVASTAGLSTGNRVLIGTGGSAETLAITGITDSTHFTTAAAANTHATGDPVYLQFTTVAAGATRTFSSYANGDNLFVGATVPGDYSFYVFKDVNGNGSYDAAQDDATPTFTLHVKDVTANTSTSSDDLDFGLSAPTSSGIGQTIPATAALTGLTTSDTRGGTTLGDRLAAATTFAYTGTATGQASTGSPTYSGSSGKFSRSSGTVTAPGSVITTATLGTASATTSTNVTSNGVTQLALTAPTVTGSVATSGGTVSVKTGTGTVSYTATAKDGSNNPVSGATVYFTVGGTAAQVANITTDGTTVDTSSTTSHVYSAVTDSTGVATLKVTSSATTAATTYTVGAQTNNVTAAPSLTATYSAPAATSVSITSSASDLTPVAAAGSTAPIKGSLTDQFGAPFTGSTGTQQVDLYFGTTASNCTAVSFAAPKTSTSANAHAAISGGTFSYTYTPSTTPSSGQCTSFGVGYDTNGDGSIQAGESVVGTINWGTATAAAKVVLTTPADGATKVTLQDNVAPINATQANAGSPAFGNTTGAVTGTVTDSTKAPLAFKPVTLSGDDGVYFATQAAPDATHQLSKTLSVVTNNSGAITGAYVFFTKAGTIKVNATSGTVSATSTVTTLPQAASEAYTVTANDTAGTPGSTLILTGKVTDIFGNPVPGATVNLNTGTSTIGALGTPSPQTNSDGVWSTTFITGSNQDGEATLTATLNGQTQNATPIAAFATDGISSLPTGDYQTTATVTVTGVKLGIGSTAPSNTVSSGANGAKVTITGTFLPGASIQILGKASGASSYSLVEIATADSTGKYSATFTVKKSTVFIAQSNGMSSSTKSITVKSSVSLTAKADGKGKVTLSANGNPNGKFHLSFYRSKTGTDPRVAYRLGNSAGVATVVISAPKGTDKFYVTFTAPGTSKGTSKTVSVKVK